MKKSLIALAVMAAAGAASAQSSVTLFGIVDVGFGYGKGSATKRYQMINNGYNSSRLGFRGTEDLGGGMSASFWLEAGINPDNGSALATNINNQASGGALAGMNGSQGLTFGRRSTVSLAGNWGELRLGRDYTPQFWNITVFDPFGTNGVGTNQVLNSIITGVTAVRASNSYGYFLPARLGGFYGQVAYYQGENPTPSATSKDGTGVGARLGFASGPFNVALALSRTEYAAGDVNQNNLGGQWDFGMAKLMGMIERDENGVVEGRGWLIGGLVPVGAGEIRVAFSEYRTDLGMGGSDPKARKFALGYVHNLSKRTAVYTTIARVRNSGVAAGVASQALNGSSTFGSTSSNGFDIGVRHSF